MADGGDGRGDAGQRARATSLGDDLTQSLLAGIMGAEASFALACVVFVLAVGTGLIGVSGIVTVAAFIPGFLMSLVDRRWPVHTALTVSLLEVGALAAWLWSGEAVPGRVALAAVAGFVGATVLGSYFGRATHCARRRRVIRCAVLATAVLVPFAEAELRLQMGMGPRLHDALQGATEAVHRGLVALPSTGGQWRTTEHRRWHPTATTRGRWAVVTGVAGPGRCDLTLSATLTPPSGGAGPEVAAAQLTFTPDAEAAITTAGQARALLAELRLRSVPTGGAERSSPHSPFEWREGTCKHVSVSEGGAVRVEWHPSVGD